MTIAIWLISGLVALLLGIFTRALLTFRNRIR